MTRRVLPILVAVLIVPPAPASAASPKTGLVSRTSRGVGANDLSLQPSLSANGRFVAFKSDANNLSRADDNSVTNIFVHDRRTGKTRLISKTSKGAGANGSSDHPSISANGRFVAFQSEADNLSQADDNSVTNVFVHDRRTGKTRLVSKSSGGAAADGDSDKPSISADGRLIAFESEADNLSGADVDLHTNVYVHDRKTRKTLLISKTSQGVGADGGSGQPSISGEGRFVVFESEADNLSGAADDAFLNIFVHDRRTRRTTLMSKTSQGVGADHDSARPSISHDGRLVVFKSEADNLSPIDDDSFVNIFVHDRRTKKTRLVSRTSGGVAADGNSDRPVISGNGRYVAFSSSADNLSAVDDDDLRDIFIRDLKTRKTRLVSRASNGKAANGLSELPFPGRRAISYDGRFVGFESDANNLSKADDNSVLNIFVRGPLS